MFVVNLEDVTPERMSGHTLPIQNYMPPWTRAPKVALLCLRGLIEVTLPRANSVHSKPDLGFETRFIFMGSVPGGMNSSLLLNTEFEIHKRLLGQFICFYIQSKTIKCILQLKNVPKHNSQVHPNPSIVEQRLTRQPGWLLGGLGSGG